MRVTAQHDRRGPLVASTAVIGSLALLGFAVLTDQHVMQVVPAVVAVSIFAATYQSLLTWQNLFAAIITVIFFIPIKRYQLPVDLPLDVEPYRLVVAFVLAGWLCSLLIDPRVRLRRSAFDAPLLLIAFAILASILANRGRVSALSSEVLKTLTFFASFFFVLYFVASTLRKRANIDFIIRLLVTSGAVVGVFALIERRTGYNIFDHLSSLFPLLQFQGVNENFRGGRLRVLSSAQHPIAAGALLAFLLPLGIYLARKTSQRRWWVAIGIMLLAALATGSRTAVIMLIVESLVFLRLRPAETRRLWPVLVPAVVIIHAVVPGAIGTVRGSFFPQGGLIAEQSGRFIPGSQQDQLSSGRIADLRPSITELLDHGDPLFGEGQGTRITGFDARNINARILDDQWLSTLMETGALGVLAWIWLFTRAGRRLARAAREDGTALGWLFTALTASLTAFAVAMFTFDTFSFIQMPFMLFILLGLSSAALRLQGRREPHPSRA